jgi:hypothetical protein
MKKCTYCGRENDDNATHCSGCFQDDRFELEATNQVEALNDQDERVRMAAWARPVPRTVKVLGALEITSGAILIIVISLSTIQWIRSDASLYALLLIVPCLFIAVGIILRRGTKFGRYLSTIAYAIRLLGFPIGTVWGLLGLYFLWINEDVKSYYEQLETFHKNALLRKRSQLRPRQHDQISS